MLMLYLPPTKLKESLTLSASNHSRAGSVNAGFFLPTLFLSRPKLTMLLHSNPKIVFVCSILYYIGPM